MKYLAILKDSLREAVDNKILFVMIGLSVLVSLFVLTATFTPLPPEKVMERAANRRVPFIDLGHGEGKRRGQDFKKGKREQAEEFQVQKVEAVRGRAGEPDASYRVTVNFPQKDEAEAQAVRSQPNAALERLRWNLWLMGDQIGTFQVKDARFTGGQGRDVLFEFTTEPHEGVRLAWPHAYSLLAGAVPLGEGMPLGPAILISTVGLLWIGSLVTLLVSVIITAFFIPNMLRKGAIDVLLTKPIRRPALLVYKYVGGLTFILVNTTVAILGMWLALGLRSGVWINSFLVMIFVYTFFFAILYAVSALFGVLTRSSITAILMTCGVWFFLFIIGLLYQFAELTRLEEKADHVPAAERSSDNAFWTGVRAVHFVLPRTSDINSLGNEALMSDLLPPRILQLRDLAGMRPSFDWGESITVSLLFIAVMLGLACWRFATRDY